MLDGARLSLLGGFDLQIKDHRVGIPTYCQRLLAHIAIIGNCPRSLVAGALWPETSNAAADHNLRTALCRVNKALPDVMLCEQRVLRLAPWLDVDLHELREWIRFTLDSSEPIDMTLPPDSYGAELLPGWCDDWVEADRAQLHLLQISAFETLAEALRRTQRPGAALYAAYQAIRADPLRESAHRIAIRIHIDQGNLHSARQHARMYRAMLTRDLGIPPTGEFNALFNEIHRTANKPSSVALNAQSTATGTTPPGAGDAPGRPPNHGPARLRSGPPASSVNPGIQLWNLPG